MSWKNQWNRKREGWVERKRRFRKICVETVQKLAVLKVPATSRAIIPAPALGPNRGEK
jgi:hypothetical protein